MRTLLAALIAVAVLAPSFALAGTDCVNWKPLRERDNHDVQRQQPKERFDDAPVLPFWEA